MFGAKNKQKTTYVNFRQSPLGDILLASDGKYLTRLCFEDQSPFDIFQNYQIKNLPVFEQTKKWLDIYFSGKNPDFIPAISATGTVFQKSVWKILQQIPFGQTATYQEIAAKIASKKNVKTMSVQAVGNALNKNPVLIIIPCHRIIGKNGSLTGYAGGLDKKAALLQLEQKNLF